MSATADPSASPTNSNLSPSESKQIPPAFLDLADSRMELKRQEHERQRQMKRKMFEEQMRDLEQQQQQELLNIPFDANANGFAVSAPTTPPRQNAALADERVRHGLDGNKKPVDADVLSKAVGFAVDKRKSVTYAPSVLQNSDVGGLGSSQSFARVAGAKSMPASRRTSASEHDADLAGHLQGLSLAGEQADMERAARASPLSATPSVLIDGSQYVNGFGGGNGYNAGMMLDEQLDQEMHNAMRNLPTPADDSKFPYSGKVSSAALDLAQHPSRAGSTNSFASRPGHEGGREKASEWPQFEGAPRGPEGGPRTVRRTATNPGLVTLGDANRLGTMSTSNTPVIGQGLTSRRGSPLSSLGPDAMPALGSSARSVPGTPMGGMSNPVGMSTAQLLKTPGTPLTPETQNMSTNGRFASSQSAGNVLDAGLAGDLQASLSRIPSTSFDNTPLTFDSIGNGFDTSLGQYGVESVYNLDNGRYENFGGLDGNGRAPGGGGSTALYQHGGSRYGLGMNGRVPSAEGKYNGLGGAKHKRGEVDRECEFNRFAGTRLEDLQGEIPGLCKDQHGCRYLQKKLEEGVPEHRDMIFRETFGHFADLMTDPFGNYLCQKLLEYASDEQRNLICESVAQDLVDISLNMHGTRAVQKMIDFLSTRRQIHSIIVALSLHVVVLIKDLNGNHVIQKCLNKLVPDDNQFIYNAVAANCVEVATHRHGCCVLQRCIDHASDHQRVQLVNEITYNALTLVQDPYGNYVVQYVLDLNDNRFSDAVIRQFTGNVCALSVQKFSSNVIEKCVRVAEHNTRKLLIEELLNRTRLEKLLRDSYGNYCVQTALDYAEPTQRALLVEGIRPVLPLIRNTPYGKRIQNKLQREQQQMDHFGGGGSFHNQHMAGLAMSGHGGMGGMPSQHGLGGGRHMSPQSMHTASNGLSDVYSTPQGGLYSLQGQGQAQASQLHAGQLHGLQPHSVDSYVLQGNSAHNQGLAAGFSNVTPFGSRSSFGYGM